MKTNNISIFLELVLSGCKHCKLRSLTELPVELLIQHLLYFFFYTEFNRVQWLGWGGAKP